MHSVTPQDPGPSDHQSIDNELAPCLAAEKHKHAYCYHQCAPEDIHQLLLHAYRTVSDSPLRLPSYIIMKSIDYIATRSEDCRCKCALGDTYRDAGDFVATFTFDSYRPSSIQTHRIPSLLPSLVGLPALSHIDGVGPRLPGGQL